MLAYSSSTARFVASSTSRCRLSNRRGTLGSSSSGWSGWNASSVFILVSPRSCCTAIVVCESPAPSRRSSRCAQLVSIRCRAPAVGTLLNAAVSDAGRGPSAPASRRSSAQSSSILEAGATNKSAVCGRQPIEIGGWLLLGQSGPEFRLDEQAFLVVLINTNEVWTRLPRTRCQCPIPPRRCSCGEDARFGRASSPRSPWGLGGLGSA